MGSESNRGRQHHTTVPVRSTSAENWQFPIKPRCSRYTLLWCFGAGGAVASPDWRIARRALGYEWPFMARLLLVSNRLPVTAQVVEGRITIVPSPGGLATGLRAEHE